MEKAEESATESKPEYLGVFILYIKSSIIELKFFKRIFKRLIIASVYWIDSCKNNRFDLSKAGEWLLGSEAVGCNRVSDLYVEDVFDVSKNVAYFTRTENLGRLILWAENSDF